MYLQTLIVYALVFFRSDQVQSGMTGSWREWLPALLGVAFYLLTVACATGGSTWWTLRRMHGAADDLATEHHRYHRRLTILKAILLLGFAGLLYVTSWPQLCYGLVRNPFLRIACDVLMMAPFFAGAAALWALSFAVERVIREETEDLRAATGESAAPLSRWSYVAFNFRFHVLVVALPMLIILFAGNVTRGYAGWITRNVVAWRLAPDLALGGIALLIFVLSPLMLTRVWSTHRLEDGPLRRQLEDICRRINLRCRDILVWRSDGMMINAAVMGMLAPVRYVLLSDGLLASMDHRQIEAVFGHEAGHVRRRHIEYFLLFAFVAMLAVSGGLELAARWLPGVSGNGLELMGVTLTILVWGLGFGFVSRRFEREADLFGAGCVTPPAPQCASPCAVHPDAGIVPDASSRSGLVCSTAASVFASALDRVALLNGIEHDEWSWRHSSIGSRMRFLTAAASDPSVLWRFRDTLRRIKFGLLATAAGGGAFALYYCVFGDPVLLRMAWG